MFHNQHESRGVHLSDYIESESDSGMKRFSLQDGQMSNCMLSARFQWYSSEKNAWLWHLLYLLGRLSSHGDGSLLQGQYRSPKTVWGTRRYNKEWTRLEIMETRRRATDKRYYRILPWIMSAAGQTPGNSFGRDGAREVSANSRSPVCQSASAR